MVDRLQEATQTQWKKKKIKKWLEENIQDKGGQIYT